METLDKLIVKLKTKRQNKFLSSFKVPILRQIIYFYHLESKCMDLRKRQCLQKVIRENINTKQVWKAIIKLNLV